MNKIQKIGSMLLLCAFNSFVTFAQGQDVQVQQLLSERATLAAGNQDYSNVEKQIVDLGQLPPALVTKSIVDGKTRFEFNTYKNIRPERAAMIAERIKTSSEGLESIAINDLHVTAVFMPSATAANITDFFKLMGYASYEIKTN